MALAIWQGAPRDESEVAAAALGMSVKRTEGQPKQPTVEVWPENEVPMLVFRAMRTQWRVGMAGPYALDYSVMEFAARQVGVGKKALKASFGAIQQMECAVIELIAESRKD